MAFAAFVLALGLTAAAPPETPAIVYGRDVEIAAGQITLGDVADLSALPAPLREKAGRLIVARFPAGRDNATFSAARLSERGRALMPALAPWLPATEDATITVRRAAGKPVVLTTHCLRVSSPVDAGVYSTAETFIPAPCGETPARAAFQYDRKTGLVRTTRALAVDEVVSTPPAGTLATVRPGQPLYLTATIGAVTIQRDVVAVRAAGEGEPVLVRAKDGSVFSAPISELKP